ncbi:helix-turn-helix transcriptional regulator [Pseudorhodoferax sp. Leaf267]|uniref:helix-turn-helix domain-containing protein n=1 Tax=Pseudorhodoferax sp. Leaf267 TaxID=1736316 RepID=UPI0006F667E9|nr:helix-turn-helix transcriptional regulator [Pseudorhodoferax sp. Leaf267]KQP20046.1 transcription factor [Pseudorhodoferax sp. Leaf267]
MPTALVEHFGISVRQLREQRGWSQEQLAALSGLNRSYVGEIERGQVIVSIVTVQKLASALELDAAGLLARSAQIGKQRQARGLQLAAIAG